MTPAEQNIAIAEACGWKAENCWHPCNCLDEYHSEGHWLDSELPSYTTDLNAMHEAVTSKFHGDFEHQGFLDNLLVSVLGEDVAQQDGSYAESWAMVSAPADKWAEAFLKTIGKWKE